MTVEGALTMTERFSRTDTDKVVEAAAVLRAEVLRLRRVLHDRGYSSAEVQGLAPLPEHRPSKPGVAGSIPATRSIPPCGGAR